MEESDNKHFRNAFIEGRSPQEFITQRVWELRAAYAKQTETALSISGTSQPGKYDIAYLVQLWIKEGIITEEEVSLAVSQFGLTADEEKVFVSQTLPEIREFMAEENQKAMEEAAHRRVEHAKKYVERWGVDRLDAIAGYFQKNLKKLMAVNPYWNDALARYSNQRTQLQSELCKIDDPVKQAQRLMKALYYITFFHPSEAEQIFNDELESDSYVYLDSLLEASLLMFQTNSGKDPDLDTLQFGTGGINASVTFYDYSNPEHVKRRIREETMDKLVFGAKKLNETKAPWKKQISRAIYKSVEIQNSSQ